MTSRPTLELERALTTGALADLSVIAVFPHPDDESWAAGGLLARLATAHANVRLVTLSRGEAGHDELDGLVGQALAARRDAELAHACAALGLPPATQLGLPDGAVDPHAAARALAPLLAADLVVTFDHDGAYAHRDHTACTAATLAAAPRSARVLAVAPPRDLLAKLRRAFVTRRPELVDPRFATTPLGGRATFTLTLDDDERRRKHDALAAHRSQLRRGDVRGFLGPGAMDELLLREHYRWLDPDEPTP